MLGGFAAFGLVWGAWGATLPAVQDGAAVDDGQLGAALLLIGAGALASMRLAGAAIDRSGAWAMPVTIGLLAGALVLPGLAHSLTALCVALFALGAASGAVDVAINTEGVRAESTGKPILSLAHGSFSAAVIAGSLLAGALRQAGGDAELALGAAAALVAGIGLAVGRSPRATARSVPGRRNHPRDLRRPLLILGGICALAFFVESAWQSWGAVHLEDDLAASAGVAALAPALFAASAAVARIAVHGLIARVGERSLLRVGAFLGAVGTVLGALAEPVALALVGIAIAGGGISICAPILISIAGRGTSAEARAAALSLVTTTAYLGFVISPAAVGLLAQATTLPTALALVSTVALAVFALAGSAPAAPPTQIGRCGSATIRLAISAVRAPPGASSTTFRRRRPGGTRRRHRW